MSANDLSAILALHVKWRAGVPAGKRAKLCGADLCGANLCGANLCGANLCDADLRYVDLRGADLRDADLRDADLSSADLRGANLCDANLCGANLTSTCLDPAALLSIIPDSNIEAAGLRIHGPWVYGWRTARSQHAGSTEYAIRDEPYVAPWFSVDSETSCHPGIYLAGKSYLAKEYDGHALVACKCLRSELVHAGDKWRCKRLWIVERHPAQAGGKGGE
jgi:hypothetical protein